ncbi:unannotated protein [freshwater metagenome]|uniref:Unannotated protein n=1 Tax=freshwater metagenome TaxID=449393 RepID=A0A6J6IDM0_9ZZZZ
MIVIATFIRHHRCCLIEHRWFPLRCLCIQDAIEALEAKSCWPTIEGTGQCLLPQWSQVPLAECTRGITRLLQNLRNACSFLRNHTVVSGKHVGAFRNAAHVHGVVIAASEHCCAGRRTQCRGMELIEAHTVCRNTIKRRRGHWSTECAARTKADIVQQNEHNVRSTLWRFRHLHCCGSGIGNDVPLHPGEHWCWLRQRGAHGQPAKPLFSSDVRN